MKILILGCDGYIGWPLMQSLIADGHTVIGVDCSLRRIMVQEVHSVSAIPIESPSVRKARLRHTAGSLVDFYDTNLSTQWTMINEIVKEVVPDTIIHLAEQPSAPYSMIDAKHAIFTQHNNVEGTLKVLFAMKEYAPKAHLVKIGTMGEYGTPNVAIPEGFFNITYRDREATLPFPRQPGSFYHASKVHDSVNIALACKDWNLRSTDIMQGVLYGTRVRASGYDFSTRFDFDEYFGTVINRFIAQAIIDHPLTVYGAGKQQRGFLALTDSIQCLKIITTNPPDEGQYRVINQLDEIYNVDGLAKLVSLMAGTFGLKGEIQNLDNPRVEAAEHFYQVDRNHLRDLGFKPTRTLSQELQIMFNDLIPYKKTIEKYKHVIMPKTTWK